jgi:hypothetical protein
MWVKWTYACVFPCFLFCFRFHLYQLTVFSRLFAVTKSLVSINNTHRLIDVMADSKDETTNTIDKTTPKSPLQFSWTFWYIKPDKRVDWEKSLVKLIDLAFVEDFWATFNHLALPSRLSAAKINSDYYFFQKGSKREHSDETYSMWTRTRSTIEFYRLSMKISLDSTRRRKQTSIVCCCCCCCSR